MASDAAPTPSPAPRRRGRAVRIALALLAAALVSLIALGGWLFGTESGARAAFSMLARVPGASVRAEGIHGRLAGPLQVDRLSLNTAGLLLDLNKLQIDWRPSALLNRQVHVNALRVERLDYVHKVQEKSEPARLPDKIALPFKLKADSVHLDGGEIHLGPVNLIKLGPLDVNLDFDGTRYLLRLQRLGASSGVAAGSFAGSFKGEASLSAAKPYPLRATLTSGAEAIVRDQAIGAKGRIDIDGSLEQMAVSADLAVNESTHESTLKGVVVLRPFSPQPLGTADLSAQAVDLASFGKDLPHTRLDLKLSAAESGAGELVLNNSDAGLVNEKKVPLAELRVAFRQQAGRFDLGRIAATLGSVKQPAGRINGSGRYADGIFTLDLSTEALDLQRIDGRMQPTRLAGKVGLRHGAGKQEFTVDLSEPLNKQKQVHNLALSAHGVLHNATLAIDRAELRLGNGRVQATGHLDLENRQSFHVAGDVARFRLKDVGNFAQLPDLLLNGQFSLRGVRQPQLVADLAFGITESQLEGHPLRGEGKAQLRADSIDISRFLLAAGDNQLLVEGRLAQDQGQLSFTLKAPRLEQLGPSFGGAMEAKGVARGSFSRPRISADWNGRNVRLLDQLQFESLQGKADIEVDRSKPLFFDTASVDASARGMRSGEQRLGSLSAQIRFSPRPAAPFNMTIRGEGLRAGGLQADSFSAIATGTTAQHTLDMSLAEPEQNWSLNASGGLKALDSAPQWQGNIQRFDAAGRFVARLVAAAPLLVSQERVQLDRFRLDANAGYFVVEQFLRDRNGIVTRGNIERLQVAQLLKFTAKEPAVTTDLQLAGEWDVNLTGTPSGAVKIRREGGDVVMRGTRPVALGLRKLEASGDVSNGRLSLQLRAEGERLGLIDATGGVSAAAGSNPFALPPDAPVSGTIKIDVPSLSWVGALVSPTTIVEGRLQSAISLGGTVSDPRLGGPITGSALRLLSIDTGIDLRNGVLESEFQGSQLAIRNFRFPSPDGQLTASGVVDFANQQPAAQITVKAERFALFDRSDRRLRISGASQINLREKQTTINGAFNVDSGFIDISSTTMPKLSNDVVVVGRTEKKPAERGLPADIDVAISLGQGIELRGRGLDAVLEGQIRLASRTGEPLQARGTLRIAKGTFTAYGRELAIEEGVLRFNGPINNPALDILAMRRGQEVEAGVAVVGTALTPRVSLVSDPPLPEAEKLSWLVLGRGLSAAGEGDLGKLQSAAGSLLSQGAAAGVQSRLASAFGLDEFSIGSTQDSLQQRIVTLGKQISSRLYVSLESGLETAGSVLHMRYTIGRKLTVEAEAGARSAVSLFYNISFD